MYPPGYHHNGKWQLMHTWAHDVRFQVPKASCPNASFVATHVPRCMSCHKDIVVITGRANCFHDYIYITPILLL